MDKQKLIETVDKLMAPGKGLWATDATEDTLDKRFKAAGIESNAEIRRKFREILITASGLSEFVSGVILNDEIIRQKTTDGVPFTELVKNQGMLAGIKVDKKAHDLPNFPGEKVTEGLDGLRERLAEYSQMGAVFTKWRAVIAIGDGLPTQTCIEANAEVLARYAALAQEAKLVPVVEPEVLMAGKHDLRTSEEANIQTLSSVFKFLEKHQVVLEGLILKTAWVHPGLDLPDKPKDEEIAEATIRVLHSTVPESIGGIVFLSGGDTPEDATSHLNAIVKVQNLPWKVGFSFERALEGRAMEVWGAKDENSEKARQILYQRARLNSLARQGKYSGESN